MENSDFIHSLHEELTGNILPFWMTKLPDKVNGGFYGALSSDLHIHNEAPRSAVLCARMLWTYSAAYRIFGAQAYLDTAKWAYEYLTTVFWDADYGGLYWEVDCAGKPLADRKHHYAQSFGIYGLTEYYQATQEPQSLKLAQELFALLEEHAYEATHGGYTEGSSRSWGSLEDMRLSDKDLNCRKSMNTMLHMLEAYTNLLRVWENDRLEAQHKALIEIFQNHIIDSQSGHFKLFFDDAWHSLSEHISYGHDIEGSWLLWEAAEMHDDAELHARTQASALKLADATYREGLDRDGSLFYEATPQGLSDDAKHWWPQAEAMVGFYNAFQLSGEARFDVAARNCWTYIQDKLVDREHGDWHKELDRHGRPNANHFKAGPWDCPYHHSRACFEMIRRLSQ